MPPCMVEVILGAGAIERGIFLPVDEEHVVALTPPAALEMLDGEIAAT